MLKLENAVQNLESLVFVQDEPALEIALPQVFDQPLLGGLTRGKLPNAEAVVARLFRIYQENPSAALGRDYQMLVNEFLPLFSWAMSCWDFLLSTEGCRFVTRQHERSFGIRGDYRVITYKDFSRLVHGLFRRLVFEFAQEPQAPLLREWLRARFWPRIVEHYRALERPADPRQRSLTAYSYLRCVPYQFLNEFHDMLVARALRRLSRGEQQVIEVYFLNFYTELASAEQLGLSLETYRSALHKALIRLLVSNRLVYCLLRQIERY